MAKHGDGTLPGGGARSDDDATLPVPAKPPATPRFTEPVGVTGREPALRGDVTAPADWEPAPTQPIGVDARVLDAENDEDTTPPKMTRKRRGPQIGRRMRAVAGVDETLMNRVPQERARYTALGGVVIGTSLIAAFSMWFAIAEALDRTSWVIVIPAAIWGVFIFNFDRWLVSSALGTEWHRRIGTLVMRVAMAILFGVIIAEPLVLRVFQSAIVKEVQDERSAQLATLQSKLVACNPETMIPGGTTPAGCQGYVLPFSQTPGADAAELASKRTDEKNLAAQVDADQKQINTLNNEARLECVGASGPGLTGNPGVGPNCKRLRQEADTYATQHDVAAEVAQLSKLQKQISTLETNVTGAQADFEQQRTQMINQRVATAKSHQGSIGILERMGALSRLAKSSSTLFFGTWAVRLFFILVDCMPILVKFMGGVTTYDKLVGRQLADADAEHAADLETMRDERAARVRRRRAEIDVELREHRAQLGSRVSRAVHDLATEYVEADPDRSARV